MQETLRIRWQSRSEFIFKKWSVLGKRSTTARSALDRHLDQRVLKYFYHVIDRARLRLRSVHTFVCWPDSRVLEHRSHHECSASGRFFLCRCERATKVLHLELCDGVLTNLAAIFVRVLCGCGFASFGSLRVTGSCSVFVDARRRGFQIIVFIATVRLLTSALVISV